MQRVRLQVRLFKGYLMRPCTAYPTTVNCRAVKGALNGAKGVSFLVLARSLGATTTCCCCHCRHLFLINFNCFHFFAAYVSVSPYQGPTVKQQSVIAKKFFNFNEISAKNKSNLKPQMQITLLLSYNFECFFALKFAMRIFPPAKLYVCEIVVFVTRPLPRPSYLPLIPPGPIRSCQLRLSPAFDISPCGLRYLFAFSARIFLYPSSYAFYLGIPWNQHVIRAREEPELMYIVYQMLGILWGWRAALFEKLMPLNA